MSKAYAMRVRNDEQTIMKVMDIPGYSHVSHDCTYHSAAGYQIECKYAYFIGTTKAELIKSIRSIFGWGAYGGLVDLFVAGQEPYYKKY